jgi:hypothetical protein
MLAAHSSLPDQFTAETAALKVGAAATEQS